MNRPSPEKESARVIRQILTTRAVTPARGTNPRSSTENGETVGSRDELVKRKQTRPQRIFAELRTLPREEWTTEHVEAYYRRRIHLTSQQWPARTDIHILKHIKTTLEDQSMTADDWCDVIDYAVAAWPDLQRRFPDIDNLTLNVIYGWREPWLRESRDPERRVAAITSAQWEATPDTPTKRTWGSMRRGVNTLTAPMDDSLDGFKR